jgi:hypothetical protein
MPPGVARELVTTFTGATADERRALERALPRTAPRLIRTSRAHERHGTCSPRDGEPSGPGWGVLPTSPGGVHS